MEIKKSDSAQLEDKRTTFFLLGLLLAFSLLFVGLQYTHQTKEGDDLAENLEDLSQDLEMSTPPDQKDMVSAEAMAKALASQAVTQEVKPTEQPETVVDPADTHAEEPIKFTVVQKIPEFPGGWSTFMQWLTKNLKYPAAAQSKKVQGTVVVTFIVNKDGSVANIKVSTSVDPALDAEALRVMRMMPKWKPGMDRNKVCRTMIAVPVVFKL